MNRSRVLELLAEHKAILGLRFGVQFYLEDLLGRPVDLVTDKALRRELRPYVEQEALNV